MLHKGLVNQILMSVTGTCWPYKDSPDDTRLNFNYLKE